MFKLVKLIPIKTNFRIMRYARILSVIGLLLVASSAALAWQSGFNWGIDFSGGVQIEVKTAEKANLETMRRDLAEFSPTIQTVGDTGDIVSIYIGGDNQDENALNTRMADVKRILGDGVEYRNIQVVGPKVGSELKRDGVIAVILAILVMTLYIGIRFELPYAIGIGLSLIHDVIVALGLIALARYQFDLVLLAALLTLAGYSINNTVVIYDRIRENMRKYKGKELGDIIDMSINETFSRTVLTSTTTIIAVSAIYLYGGQALRGFSGIMLFGVVIGTYSSVFLSTSTLLLFRKKLLK